MCHPDLTACFKYGLVFQTLAALPFRWFKPWETAMRNFYLRPIPFLNQGVHER